MDETTTAPIDVADDPMNAGALEEPTPPSSGAATAGKALELLVANHGYIAPTAEARRNVAMAFAAKNKVVYGKAFDAIRIADAAAIDFSDFASVEAHLDSVVLCEIKSTHRDLDDDFSGYFFSLSTAELLVAQSLGPHFEFVLVNIETEAVKPLKLQQLLARVKAIYPSWSITI
jgi:hypothetical protein